MVLGKFYDTDIKREDLSSDCRMLLNNRGDVSPKTFLSFIMPYGDYIFPNLRIVLQILPVERILSYFWSSMGQDRFSNLALLSIERETLVCIHFDEVTDTFSSAKVSRIHL